MNSDYVRIETLTILKYIHLINNYKKGKANNQTSITHY